MRKYNTYTEHDDQKIIEHIRQTPGNLTTAFKRAGKELGRSEASVSARWYNSLKHDVNTDGFITRSKVSSIKNKKIARNGETPILQLVDKLLDELPVEQQKAILLNRLNNIL